MAGTGWWQPPPVRKHQQAGKAVPQFQFHHLLAGAGDPADEGALRPSTSPVNGSSSSMGSRGSAGRRSQCEVPPPQAYFDRTAPASTPGGPVQPSQGSVHILTRSHAGQPADSSTSSRAAPQCMSPVPAAPGLAARDGAPGAESFNAMSEEALQSTPASGSRTNRRARRAHLQRSAGSAPNQAHSPQQGPASPPGLPSLLPQQGSCKLDPQQQKQLWGSPGTGAGAVGSAPPAFEALGQLPPPFQGAPAQRASSAQPPSLAPLYLGASPPQGAPACVAHFRRRCMHDIP